LDVRGLAAFWAGGDRSIPDKPRYASFDWNGEYNH